MKWLLLKNSIAFRPSLNKNLNCYYDTSAKFKRITNDCCHICLGLYDSDDALPKLDSFEVLVKVSLSHCCNRGLSIAIFAQSSTSKSIFRHLDVKFSESIIILDAQAFQFDSLSK